MDFGRCNNDHYSQTDKEEHGDFADHDAIEEDAIDAAGDEDLLTDYTSNVQLETSLDASAHNILLNVVDPIEWKTELERVGPKLKASQQFGTNEWRSHVDQTLSSKEQIGKVMVDAQADLRGMFK